MVSTDALGDPQRLEFGYWLSSEEHDARSLVANAAAAEAYGFGITMLSDHFHPWVPQQGNSPFVWAVLGGIAGRTVKLRVGHRRERTRPPDAPARDRRTPPRPSRR